MAYTVEAMDSPLPSAHAPVTPELPSKSFTGYDVAAESARSKDKAPSEAKSEPKSGQVETKEEPKVPADPGESVTLSPRISAIARKEQAARQREQALVQREKDLAERLAKADKFDSIQKRIEAKDYSAAEELGMTYEQYSDYLLSKKAPDPQEERYKKVETELDALKRKQAELELKEYNFNQNLWKQEISKVVSAGEDFSTIKELGAEDVVLQHINDSFEEDGVELTVEQAAKDIEEALVARAEKFASVSKIKTRLGQPAEARTLGAPRTSSPKTITQNLTVSSEQTKPSKPFHLMSESEQIAEAIRRVNMAKLSR